jgi:GntR family transcriptional repressor for pyruvate dehydrogenase complex
VFEKVKQVRAHEVIVSQIEDMIVRGELKAGDRLPSEREMTTQFGVSRATVREALRVAESSGLIAVRQGEQGGPLVIAQPGAGVVRVFEALLRTNLGSLTDVVELRMLLEGFAAYMAAQQSKRRLAPLEDAFRQLAAAEDDDDRSRADALFHFREAEATGNPMLVVVAAALREPVFHSITVGLPSLAERRETSDVVTQRHRDVLDAIQAGDGDRACQLSRTYLHDTYAPLMKPADRARLRAMRDFRAG